MRGLKPEPLLRYIKALKVASFTDAWIETGQVQTRSDNLRVASFTDAWIETFKIRSIKYRSPSHLLQMRGLKPPELKVDADRNTSHLLQMRGLKLSTYIMQKYVIIVASFTDAWIETEGKVYDENWNESHLLQMRGLKRQYKIITIARNGRIFYRCVD